jgi:hypothetical protein
MDFRFNAIRGFPAIACRPTADPQKARCVKIYRLCVKCTHTTAGLVASRGHQSSLLLIRWERGLPNLRRPELSWGNLNGRRRFR